MLITAAVLAPRATRWSSAAQLHQKNNNKHTNDHTRAHKHTSEFTQTRAKDHLETPLKGAYFPLRGL